MTFDYLGILNLSCYFNTTCIDGLGQDFVYAILSLDMATETVKRVLYTSG